MYAQHGVHAGGRLRRLELAGTTRHAAREGVRRLSRLRRGECVPQGRKARRLSVPAPSMADMRGWRTLFAGSMQVLLLVVPFFILTVAVSNAIPGGGPPCSRLVGRWTSPVQDHRTAQPILTVELAADGRCELRVGAHALRQRSVHGRYKIVMGRLVMEFPTHRMVWSSAAAQQAQERNDE